MKVPLVLVHAQFDPDEQREGEKTKKVVCKWCSKRFSDGASRKKQHLEQQCPAYRSHLAQAQSSGTVLDGFGVQISATEKRRLDLLLADAVFEDYRPFNDFDKAYKPATVRFLNALNPAYRPPDRKTLAGTYLDIKYDEMKRRIKEVVVGKHYLNFSMDESDDITGTRVISLAVHVHGVGAIQLGIKDLGSMSANSRNLAAWAIEHILEFCDGDWSRVNSVVTDTCSTMRATHAEMVKDERFRHVFFVLCDSHGLQLLVKDIASLGRIKELLDQAQRVAVFFKRSRLHLSYLREHQIRHYERIRAFVLSVITRWGSQIGVIVAVLKNEEALMSWLRDLRVLEASQKQTSKRATTQANPGSLTKVLAILRDSTFWIGLRDLKALLLPIHEAQKMSESDRAHLGKVNGRWVNIQNEMKSMSGSSLDAEITEIFKPGGMFYHRFQRQHDDLHWVAWALDPATLNTRITTPIQDRVLRVLRHYIKNTRDSETAKTLFYAFRASEHPFSRLNENLWDDNLVSRPINFWRYIQGPGGPLADMAIRVYSTIANSVPNERSFSAMNLIKNSFRSQLTIDRLDKLVTISMNARLFRRGAEGEAWWNITEEEEEQLELDVTELAAETYTIEDITDDDDEPEIIDHSMPTVPEMPVNEPAAAELYSYDHETHICSGSSCLCQAETQTQGFDDLNSMISSQWYSQI